MYKKNINKVSCIPEDIIITQSEKPSWISPSSNNRRLLSKPTMGEKVSQILFTLINIFIFKNNSVPRVGRITINE